MKFTTRQVKDELKNMITLDLSKDGNGRYVRNPLQQLPIYLEGFPGIGKTQIVREAAEELGIGFLSYSMVHLTRQSLLGLPEITSFSYGGEEIKDTRYTLSEIIGSVYRAVEEGHREGILLLDEANCAPETIQPSLLSFLQTKVLGNSSLPEGWIIVLCGNPPRSIYNKNAKSFDAALMDRLRVVNLVTNNAEFYGYAKNKDFHNAVLFYLFTHRDDSYLCEEGKDKRLELVTYRTWENLSDTIKLYESNHMKVTPIVINEFIKNDRITKDFYEIYKYSRTNDEEYKELSNIMLGEDVDFKVFTMLKNKPSGILYGVTSYCFGEISRNTSDAFNCHEFLSKLKQAIKSGEVVSVDALALNAKVPKSWIEELEKTLNPVDGAELKAYYNSRMNELKDMTAKVSHTLDNFVSNLDELDNKTLLKYYLNMLSRKEMWIYLLESTQHDRLDEIREKYSAA